MTCGNLQDAESPDDNRPSPPTTSFISRRVNASTFLIIEDDAYGEQPHIYIKLYPAHLLITDTGCNTPRRMHLTITSLRQYLETFPVPSNNHLPLNPNYKKEYIIICSHSHYDHILGIPQFFSVPSSVTKSSKTTIIASGFCPSFILHNLPKHSLCKYIHVPTPSYTITQWANHLSYNTHPQFPSSSPSFPLRIQFLHIPGHTPDSLAWYDIDEHHLYVGDTFYEHKRAIPIPELPDDAGQVPGLPATQAAIVFPEEGDWVLYMSSLDLLLSFSRYRNEELRRQYNLISRDGDKKAGEKEEVPRVLVGCGHLTISADAEEMVLEVQALFWRIIKGSVPVKRSGEKRGVVYDFWLESEESRYSVMAPRRLAEEARKHFSL